jgi:hypothetical protein
MIWLMTTKGVLRGLFFCTIIFRFRSHFRCVWMRAWAWQAGVTGVGSHARFSSVFWSVPSSGMLSVDHPRAINQFEANFED